MDSRIYCAYNLTRDATLSQRVTVAHAEHLPAASVRTLIHQFSDDAESGLWLTQLSIAAELSGFHACVLIYLDSNLRVIERFELLPGAAFPWSDRIASALLLPIQTLAGQTMPGDHLSFCDVETIKADREQAPPSVEETQVPESAAAPPPSVENEESSEESAYPYYCVLFAKAATPVAVGTSSQFTFTRWSTPAFDYAAVSASPPAEAPLDVVEPGPDISPVADSDPEPQAELSLPEPVISPKTLTGVFVDEVGFVEQPAVAQHDASPVAQIPDPLIEAAAVEAASSHSPTSEAPLHTEAAPSSPPASAADSIWDAQVVETETQDPDEPRFYFPKRVRFFDPAAEEAGKAGIDGSPNGNPNRRESTHLPPELQAVILQLSERQKVRNKGRSG
jgi:hypothetical protein